MIAVITKMTKNSPILVKFFIPLLPNNIFFFLFEKKKKNNTQQKLFNLKNDFFKSEICKKIFFEFFSKPRTEQTLVVLEVVVYFFSNKEGKCGQSL